MRVEDRALALPLHAAAIHSDEQAVLQRGRSCLPGQPLIRN